jgi:hypothetical protein
LPPADNKQLENQIVLSPNGMESIAKGTYTMTINLSEKPSNGVALLTLLGATTYKDIVLSQGVNSFSITVTEDTYLFLSFKCLTSESALFTITKWTCE